MAPAGITTRHHLPSTNPTSSNVGITCFSLSSLHLRRDARMLTEKRPNAPGRVASYSAGSIRLNRR
jgi:hypothetical protein